MSNINLTFVAPNSGFTVGTDSFIMNGILSNNFIELILDILIDPDSESLLRKRCFRRAPLSTDLSSIK